ncbi:MAG: response regulator [Phyllobacteriaceae bacterium]|nr:response regulator [Phyllobacteriaceae bacterium]
MSITALISPQLPLLRRYARALSGSQASGDNHVVAMLEALVADPSGFDRSLEPRVAVYKLFSSVWNANPMNRLVDEPETGSAPDCRIEAITPLPRQAFLLTAVEGFSPWDAAVILGVDADAFADLLTEASRQIGEQVSSRVLVIEDEPIIAMDLEALVESLGHTVVGNARTRDEAVEMARRTRPGLVLADIRLADGSSGLDAVNDILVDFEVPVIFITAYPEMLLTGTRPEPTFLIAKPFREDTVKAVVSQALFFDTAASLGLKRSA